MLQGTSFAAAAAVPDDEDDFRLFLFEEEDSAAAPDVGAAEVDEGREDEEDVEEVRFFPSSFIGSR